MAQNKKDTNALLKDAKYGGHEQFGEIARFAAGLSDQPDESILAAVREKFGEPVKPLAKLGEQPAQAWAVSFAGEVHQTQPDALKDATSFAAIPGVTGIALMPDLHRTRENNAPVGMALRTSGTLVPGAIGNDPGCSVMLTILPQAMLSPDALASRSFREEALGAMERANCGPHLTVWDQPTFSHSLWENDLWLQEPFKTFRNLAERQIGTIGNGNHFITLYELQMNADLQPGLQAGDRAVAIATHFGARGLGAKVIDYYAKLAVKETAKQGFEADKEHAWFAADSEIADTFFAAYQLLEQYALHGHRLIANRVAKMVSGKNPYHFPVVEFATTHNGITQDPDGGYTHRKGAAPAFKGQIGVIPGTCGTPGALVMGGGNASALFSTNHGAGREQSRTKALEAISQAAFDEFMEGAGVAHRGVSLDESPMAYRDIRTVMEQVQGQRLAETVGILTPRAVLMSGEEQKPWR